MKLCFDFKKDDLFAGFSKSLILLCALHLCMMGLAQDRLLPVFKAQPIEVNNSILRNSFRHFSAIVLDSKKLSVFVSGNNKSSFRLHLGSDKQWDIDLEPSGITSDNYQLKVLAPGGMQNISSHPNFLFKGKVTGSNKDEQVRLTVKEGFVYGSIQTGGKEYFIEPLNRFTKAKTKDQYVVYECSDIMEPELFSCGVQDKETTLKKIENQNNLKEQSPLDIICKKIKFISIADYSMFQKFRNDVFAIETSFLSILNLAEGAYTTLNFGPDGSTDVGTDKLQFEMEEVVVSTCSECDIAPGEENASTIGTKLSSWTLKNVDQRQGKIIQHWTANSLYDAIGRGLSGTIATLVSCNDIGSEILRYGTDNPSFLSVLVAHETGHIFGCPHDDLVKSSVTGFIMYSGANESRTRFSTLADFGGVNYSSQQTIRNSVLTNISCLADCGNNTCVEVKDLKIDYGNFDKDVQLSWTGSGSFLVKYKINDSSSFNPANLIQTNLNTITFKGLDPCALYHVEVQRNCGSSFSKGSAIIFKTSSLTINSKPVNVHGDKYDLQLDVECKRCSDKNYFIKIDGVVQKAGNSSSSGQIFFKDLFADGARHRIEISKDSANAASSATSFYTAPYYRSSSKKLLNGDFNDCSMPPGWEDSLLAKRNTAAPDARWIISQQNFFVSRTPRGSLDSTCMIYYNNLNASNGPYSGALSLTSPKIDLTKYKNIKLHYDYNFLAYKFANIQPVGSITVEAFNGIGWQKIFVRQADMPNILRDIWDSVPQRVFVDLDSFKNKDFQVRFIVDDGSLINKGTLGVFAAFDNIVVDGYLKDFTTNNDIIIYPNPTRGEVFVQFSQQPITDITYSIIDMSGKLLSKGTLTNYRINLGSISRGMYLLLLYENNEMIGVKKILRL